MKPKIDPTATIIGQVYISGDVEIAKDAFILPFCSIRGDMSAVRIGEGTNVQDGVIIHTIPEAPTTIGKNVSVGHGAVVHGATIGDDCIIGMNATILKGPPLPPRIFMGRATT